MKLYEIDSQYMEYLYKADSKVLINGYKYFVPLSSPDKRDYYNDQDGQKKFNLHEFQLLKEYLMEIQRLNHI